MQALGGQGGVHHSEYGKIVADLARRAYVHNAARDVSAIIEIFLDAVTALAALAQDNRLDIFRLLVQAGPEGMPAGAVATALDLAPNTLTFHFDRLRTAGLVTVRRDGRSMIYAAQYKQMNALLGFLTENCCAGAPAVCAGTTGNAVTSKRKIKENA